MRYPESFKLSTPSDREIQVVRLFGAPRQLVFDAFTNPDLVRQWLLGPPGWTMPVCEIDLRVGGKYRYVWRKGGVKDMGMSGVFREIARPRLIVATEKFDESWYPGEGLDTTLFEEKDGATRVTVTILYESKEARDIASRSGMERGMAAGYDRLEQMLQRRITQPEITTSEQQAAAVIHIQIPRSRIQAEMGPAIRELMTTLAGQGMKPIGPMFAHHLTTSSESFDFEVGFPVSEPVTPSGRVKPSELPAAKIARSEYHGEYEGLFQAWGEFGHWMKSAGLTGRGDLWERYVSGPESDPDPRTWLTELCIPLAE